jgi:hypothetical protein
MQHIAEADFISKLDTTIGRERKIVLDGSFLTIKSRKAVVEVARSKDRYLRCFYFSIDYRICSHLNAFNQVIEILINRF